MDMIRWGMIGCGDVTEVKSGPAFQKVPGSSLVAVMSRNGKKAADWASRHQVPRWYDDAQALIDDPQVDAIYIATPPDSHMQYTEMAAKAKKPVYCEKPMGFSYEHATQMVQACKDAGVPLYSAYYRRALAKYVLIRKMLSDKVIGNVRAVTVLLHQKPMAEDRDGTGWRMKPEISGGGRFYDVACHALDLLDWYLGPITSATGVSGRQEQAYEGIDIVSGAWSFADGVQGSGLWVFNAWSDHDRVELIGDLGTIVFSVTNLAEPITLISEGETRTIGIPQPPQHVAQPLIESVVRALLGTGICPSTGESAKRTDWVMSQIIG